MITEPTSNAEPPDTEFMRALQKRLTSAHEAEGKHLGRGEANNRREIMANVCPVSPLGQETVSGCTALNDGKVGSLNLTVHDKEPTL